MTRKLSLPDVTRVEVIAGAGRAFVGRFTPGASVHVQDEGRTVKVFAAEDQLTQMSTLRDLQNEVAAALEDAPALLDNPEYGGTLVDVISGRLHLAGFSRTATDKD